MIINIMTEEDLEIAQDLVFNMIEIENEINAELASILKEGKEDG